MRKEISDSTDIKVLIDTFYSRVRASEILGSIFDDAIGANWDNHLNKMYRFWQTILFHEQSYYGSPFPPHMKLAIGPMHFDDWVRIFTKTVDDLFVGETAEQAKWRGQKIAETFQYKIEYQI